MASSVGNLNKQILRIETKISTYMNTGRSSNRLAEFVFSSQHNITMNLLFQALLLIGRNVEPKGMWNNTEVYQR